MRIIAISASYGAGGSVIAPLVAERLGVPYLDRAVAARDSERIEGEVREAAASEEELERGLWQRVMQALASTPTEFSPGGPTVTHPDQALRTEAEKTLRDLAARPSGGVVLGWAASAVLTESFKVRLDGPADRRLVQGMEIEELDVESARRRRDKTDDVRRLYWRRLYQRDWRDPDLYHLSIDSTVLPAAVVADLVIGAATAYWER